MNYWYSNQFYPAGQSRLLGQESGLRMTPAAVSKPGSQYIPAMPMAVMMDVFTDERMTFEDARRLQSFYPEFAQEIQRYVEEACDKMEYEGSMMFDEYPDRVMILRLVDEIYDKVIDIDTEKITEEMQVQEQETTKPLSMQSGRCRNCQDRDGRRDRRGDKNRLGDFIQVLLLDEMHRRRCRHRRCRRFW